MTHPPSSLSAIVFPELQILTAVVVDVGWKTFRRLEFSGLDGIFGGRVNLDLNLSFRLIHGNFVNGCA